MAVNLPTKHPGSQKLLKRSWLSANALRVLAIMSGLVMLQAFIHKNIDYRNFPLFGLWKLELMSLDQAATVFAAVLGVLIVREQYVESVMPYVTYKCTLDSKPLISLSRSDNDSRYWNTSFRNDGGGIAMIKTISYYVEFTDGSVCDSILSFEDLSNVLRSKGIFHSVDCWIAFFSSGGAIRPDHEYLLFTAPLACALKFRAIDVKITYRNLLGDLFEKSIYCIPRIGLAPYIGS